MTPYLSWEFDYGRLYYLCLSSSTQMHHVISTKSVFRLFGQSMSGPMHCSYYKTTYINDYHACRQKKCQLTLMKKA